MKVRKRTRRRRRVSRRRRRLSSLCHMFYCSIAVENVVEAAQQRVDMFASFVGMAAKTQSLSQSILSRRATTAALEELVIARDRVERSTDSSCPSRSRC